ncbi:phospholipid scramblase 2-like, partial [Pteronotus mesoamericanus]|uniref:phospholipid scramblase 2-like n=1 Tax=Pteronotus mesoamericanus TaxID=1884717 RepID=UPI0023ECE1CB
MARRSLPETTHRLGSPNASIQTILLVYISELSGCRIQPGPQDAYPDPQDNNSVPTPSHSSAGSVGFPIQHQPVYSQPAEPLGPTWMPAPLPPPDCPPGLEYLSKVDKILIHQQVDLMEVIINVKACNKYEIKNSLGQMIYFAVEENDFCTRNCCGYCRPFTMRILDLRGQEVITLERPLKCSGCCCQYCLQQIKIYSPPGTLIGSVIQTMHPYLPKFTIQNENKEDILTIIGPFFACKCCGDIDFEIKSLDDEEVVGKISKQWTDFVREFCTDYSNFDVHFYLDLDVKTKAVMLGACFLIDFMFYEKKSSNGQEKKA